MLAHPEPAERVLDRHRVAAVEHWRYGAEAHAASGPAQVCLQHLADVHTARHADRVEDDVDGRAVGQVGHVLHRQDAGDDALVAVAPRHLVALGDLAPLRDRDSHHRLHAGRQLVRDLRVVWPAAVMSRLAVVRPVAVVVRAGEEASLYDLAALAVGHAQRGVLHLARLLAEDRPQQLLLRRQLGLALGRDLADEDVAGLHLGADADDAVLVEVAEALLADVGDVAGDLLGPELGVAAFDLVLLDVDGGELVVLRDLLRDDDRVLEVVALPAHEGAEERLAQRQLTGVGRGAIGQRLAGLDLVAALHQGAVVDAGALV